MSTTLSHARSSPLLPCSVKSVVIDSFPPTLLGSGSRTMLAVILASRALAFQHAARFSRTRIAHTTKRSTRVPAVTYPIQIAPVFQLVESTIALRRPAARGMWPATRAVIVGLTAFASFLIPDMEKMVALTGGVMFSFIGFILPGAFFLKLRPPPALPGHTASPTEATFEVVTAITLVALGTVGGVFSVYSELFAPK